MRTRKRHGVSPGMGLVCAALAVAAGCKGESSTEPDRQMASPHTSDRSPTEASTAVTTTPPTWTVDDAQIAEAVRLELMMDPATPSETVHVTTASGVVELSGTVGDLLAKRRATRIAEVVKGVRTVSNRLRVAPDAPVPDDRLARDIEDAWRWDPAADSYELEVDVKDGVATLRGTVDSWSEKELSEKIAASVRGVLDIENDIGIDYTTRRTDPEMKAEVEGRLKWDVLVHAADLRVAVENAKVVLSGRVGSAAERRRAAADAWVRGVKSVDTDGVVIDWAEEDPNLRESGFAVLADDEIREGIELAALYDPRVHPFDLDVDVHGGVVTLDGSVDNIKAKHAAEQLARHTTGVVHVINSLTVVPADERKDAKIAADIKHRLLTDPYTDSYEIDVDVDDGWVTLTGEVETYLEKAEAEDVANKVHGVVGLADKLRVDDMDIGFYYRPYVYPYHPYIYPWRTHVPPISALDDEQLTKNIHRELFWSPFVDEDEVHVSVSAGDAILTGTVDSWRERDAATENAFQAGALGVDNRLQVADSER